MSVHGLEDSDFEILAKRLNGYFSTTFTSTEIRRMYENALGEAFKEHIEPLTKSLDDFKESLAHKRDAFGRKPKRKEAPAAAKPRPQTRSGTRDFYGRRTDG